MSQKIRWCTPKDFKKIANTEYEIYGDEGLTTQDISDLKSKIRNNHILIYEDINYGMLAYMIYNTSNHRTYIHRLVVLPKFRNSGIGTKLLNKAISTLNDSRNSVVIDLEDNLLNSHLFLKNRNFIATKVVKGSDDENDIYIFKYTKVSNENSN